LAEQVIATAREERDELKPLNDSYVRRIGRLEADRQFLLRDIGDMEDAGVGEGPTWQMLRSQRDTLRKQNAMLRWRISRMKAEPSGATPLAPAVGDDGEEGHEEVVVDDSVEGAVGEEEDCEGETDQSPAVMGAGHLPNSMAHPNEGICPGLRRL
jgi:hypothetical protein